MPEDIFNDNQFVCHLKKTANSCHHTKNFNNSCVKMLIKRFSKKGICKSKVNFEFEQNVKVSNFAKISFMRANFEAIVSTKK